MRDALMIPFNTEESLVITSDNSGGIGLKQDDLIKVSYEEVAYYAFRVAMMECLAVGAMPLAVILHNFSGDEAWQPLVAGIEKGLLELGMSELAITGSTESNFQLKQSATAVSVMGKIKANEDIHTVTVDERNSIAVIGKPLVGEAVLKDAVHIAPLVLSARFAAMAGVTVIPVGSKGILYELNEVINNRSFEKDHIQCEVDLLASSGPATCFIINYISENEGEIKAIAGHYFFPIKVKL